MQGSRSISAQVSRNASFAQFALFVLRVSAGIRRLYAAGWTLSTANRLLQGGRFPRSAAIYEGRAVRCKVFFALAFVFALTWPGGSLARPASLAAKGNGAAFSHSKAPAQTRESSQAAPPPSVGQRLADDLQWSPAERQVRFAHMDRLFPVNTVNRGRHVHPLPAGRPLNLRIAGQNLQAVMLRNGLAGVLVLQHGTVRVEAYGLHATQRTRWTSFSVTKSITSTLVGAAIVNGSIRSLDDAVPRYLPELRGSAYDDVTVRQLLTMTSGVRWIEAYDAPDSDNVRLYHTPATPGTDPVVTYMRRLPRLHPPGTTWNYNTGEADLAGSLLRRASGKSLSALLSEAVWKPFGMERDATWIADDGREFGGSGLSATLRDFGRFGEFALAGSAGQVLPGWFAEATHTAQPTGMPGRGYGMGWWTFDDGSYASLGIFGQSIRIDPKRNLICVTLGAWPQATSAALAQSRDVLWQAITQAIDEEH